jgi:hypothetical protein
MLTACSISHIALIDNRNVLVSTDGLVTAIYTFATDVSAPFKDVWKRSHELLEAKNMRVQVSGVGRDIFIISDDDFRLQFYSKKSEN